ncbi:MAG: hypothetical protein WAV90_13955 [Gordonia amarae]
MGNFIQVPPKDLKDLGDALNRIAEMLNEQKNKGHVIDGLDTKHGKKHVEVAEKGFVNAWSTSIRKLLEAIGNTGNLAIDIGTNAANIDSKIGESGNKAANDLSTFNLHM